MRTGRWWSGAALLGLTALFVPLVSACVPRKEPAAKPADPVTQKETPAPASPAPTSPVAPAPPPAPATPAEDGPVNTAAFQGLGKLAYVYKGKLFMLDGQSGRVTALTHDGYALAPAWSADGSWIAYLKLDDPRSGAGRLWFVKPDGTGAHAAEGLDMPVYRFEFSWSPTAAQVVVTPSDPGARQGVYLAAPDRPARLIAAPDTQIYRALFSPDGKQIAYVTLTRVPGRIPPLDTLYTVSAEGGEPVKHFDGGENAISLAGWWPDGKGVYYWLQNSHSASLAADGAPLGSRALAAGAAEQSLTITLMNPDWLSPAGKPGQILVVQGGGREPWVTKSLALCDVVSAVCRDLPSAQGTVDLDPAFAPTGDRMAFVRAQGVQAGAQPPKYAEWFTTRTLFLANADGSGARPLSEAGGGVMNPVFSRDGSRLLYLQNDSLWAIRLEGGAPVRILGPVKPLEDAPNYGSLAWGSTLAWRP